jgi:hypothetical protein
MENGIFSVVGIDPAYIDILLLLLIIALFAISVANRMKYNRLKSNYASFMKGKDGKNLEDSILEKFDELDLINSMARQNRQDIKEIFTEMETSYQKVGIVKYDAFHEMGGNLSFALALLDGRNSGWVINAMHSREGCYTYIKEIVNGKSYIELAEEEADALEKAVYQEVYGTELQENS